MTCPDPKRCNAMAVCQAKCVPQRLPLPGREVYVVGREGDKLVLLEWLRQPGHTYTMPMETGPC